jgi:hypothetical protein
VFNKTIRSFDFKENKEDNYIYAKFRSEKFIFLILYVDDILLASSDVSLLLETKRFCLSILIRRISMKLHSFYELKFTEIEEREYWDYHRRHT